MIDALVVGAGLSGLVCATRLRDAGLTVRVVEARDRVGGRLHTGALAGAPIDLGGQWMSAVQPRLAALAAALGVDTVPQGRDGTVLVSGPELSRRLLPRLLAALAQRRLLRRITRATRSPPPDAALSLADYLDRHARNRAARALVELHAELIFATEPATLSLLHYLGTLAVTGGFGSASGGEDRFAGGAQTLALRLAEHLPVELAAPVRAITDDGAAVHARTDGATLTARHLVLAVPPPLARALVDRPAPHMGGVVKCFAAYDRASWRDDGLSGETYRTRGPIRATVALEPAGGPAILVAFVVGAAAAGWHARDPAARRADVLAAFAELTEAPPLDYLEADWSIDPWSTGCVASLTPGTTPAPHTPIGRVHFAGTETATAWPGYMEGAIEAGERAAAEILAR